MQLDARTRVRQRIKRLLDERGRTQREFATALGHGDTWASNLLRGEFALSLDQLDDVAAFLKVPPGEIVRVADEPWELSPTEMRMVRALRMLPPPVRDQLVLMADYLIGVTPDEVERLRRIRQLGEDQWAVVDHWIEMKLLEQAHEPARPHRDGPPGTATTPVGPTPRNRTGATRRR